MEHIKALHILVSYESYTSVFALVRPIYETCFRALWIMRSDSKFDIKKFENDENTFPPMQKLVKELDDFYTGFDFFKKLKSDSWSAMCDYTHTGIRQFIKQWKENELESNYAEDEIIEVLQGTSAISLLFAYAVLKEHGYDEELEKLKKN